MEDDFQKNLEKIIIRSNNKDTSFEILNPLYKRISDSNITDFVEIYTLIIINFLNFCQTIDIADIKLKGTKRDEIYIYLICKLFNMYISEVKEDLIKFDMTVPEFFDKDKFRINVELIANKMTKEIISENKKFEYIFKVILGSFNKKRNKPIGLLTDNSVSILNNFVKLIQDQIDEYFNKKSEVELTRSGLLDFNDFFDIKYDVDGDDEVYPDVYSEIERGKEKDKKKGGKGKIDLDEFEKK